MSWAEQDGPHSWAGPSGLTVKCGLGAATVVLYLAVSLGIQRAITQVRANRLQPGHGAVV
jgi:hypothetical protein